MGRSQMVWMLNELIKTSTTGCENVCLNLMKQIIGGDVTERNIALCEGVINIYLSNRKWLEKHLNLIQIAVYTYLRLLQEHVSANLASLRQKEVTFVVSMLRDKWLDCCLIGRDLIRLLSAVAKIPEIERLWSDLIHKPQTLAPTFTGIHQLLQQRTSRKFLICRVTPDMETKLNFMLRSVKFGNHKRYQEWFQRQYLQTAESQTLRSDLIRYICGCIHPSNDILCSDIIPRWALIGWLLSTCTSRVATQYNNLALFWDYLAFNPERNSIMDIEPAILVMQNSLRNHPAITTSLLDFLCRTIVEFHPPITDQLRMGVRTALRMLLDKRVVQTLSPIIDNPKLDPELKTLIRNNLQEFSSMGKPPMSTSPVPPHGDPTDVMHGGGHDMIDHEAMMMDDDDSDGELHDKKSQGGDDTQDSGGSTAAMFSDDDDDTSKKDKFAIIKSARESPSFEPRDITADIERLDETLQDLIGQLQKTDISDLDERCERMQDIIDHVLSLDEFDSDVSTPLSSCLTELLSDHFHKKIITIPSYELNDEYLETCVEKPLYVIFRNLCQCRKDEDAFSVLISLICEMYIIQPKLGYHLLFFLAVKKNDDTVFVYDNFAQSTQLSDTYNCLMMDLKHCQEDEDTMLIFLTPHVFKEFPEHCIGNSDILNIVVAVMDPQQLQELQCLIMIGELTMMKRESAENVLTISLKWESFEQYCVWQLFAAHDIPVDVALPLIQKLDPKLHAESLSTLLIALKRKKPTKEMVRHIISRRIIEYDRFSLSLLRHWAIEYTKELAEHLALLLSNSKPRNANQPRKGLRVRSAQMAPSATPTTSDMLVHVDNLRRTTLPKGCNLFSQDSIIACLVHVQQQCDDVCKSKFSELFALASDSDDEISLRELAKTNMRKRSSTKPSRNVTANIRSSSHRSLQKRDSADSDSSSSSSEEESYKSKRKRRSRANDSDSD